MEISRKTFNHNLNSNRKFQYSSIPTENSDTTSIGPKLKNRNGNTSVLSEKDVLTSNSSSATELTSLRARSSANNLTSYTAEVHRAPPPDDVVYLEREILPTDTLQSFALLYGCTVNELKRANTLVGDQDFYALRYIKIPVKRHGLLTEQLEESRRRSSFKTTSLGGSPLKTGSDNPSTSKQGKTAAENLPSDVYHVEDSEISSNENLNLLAANSGSITAFKQIAVDKNDASKYLKKVDKEIRKTVRKTDELQCERNEVLEEVVSSLGSIGYRPLLPPGSGNRTDDCDGADWGFKWWVLFLCFVFVFVIIIVVGIELYLNHQYLLTVNGSTTDPLKKG